MPARQKVEQIKLNHLDWIGLDRRSRPVEWAGIPYCDADCREAVSPKSPSDAFKPANRGTQTAPCKNQG